MPVSWAGHYDVSYENGTVTWSSPMSSGSRGYALAPDGTWGGATAIQESGTGTVNCSGAITTTFTWVSDDAADYLPLTTVVVETCSAGWDALGSEAPTG